MEHLKENADVMLPGLSPAPEEAGAIYAALAGTILPLEAAVLSSLIAIFFCEDFQDGVWPCAGADGALEGEC